MSDILIERPRVRWWPAIVIAVAWTASLIAVWTRGASGNQERVVNSIAICLLGGLGLFFWLVLLSRLPGRTRLSCFISGVALLVLAISLLEIKGVDGNLVPILGFRWSGQSDYSRPSDLRAATEVERRTDYPQFYGPNRDATILTVDLDPDWQARPPREIWRRKVGEGWSSFAIVGSAAVTLEQRGAEEVVVRYELETGNEVWAHPVKAEFSTTIAGNGPRTTPTIDAGRVFTLGATGILQSLELENGALIWSRDVLGDHGENRPEWGMASSPLVVGDAVIVQLGRRNQGLVGYDRDTGEPLWRVGEDRGTYSSPVLVDIAGHDQVLIVNRDSVTSHDPANGMQLWSAPWPNPGSERVTPPIVLPGDRVLVSAGYGVGSRMFAVTREDLGWAVEVLWDSPRLKSKFAPMILHNDTVFGLDDGILVAIDPDNGERLWKRGRYGHGQIVLVGNLLLIQAEEGDLYLVEANPTEFREIARLDALSSKTWNPPALAGNLLLVRNNFEAVCYELPLRERATLF